MQRHKGHTQALSNSNGQFARMRLLPIIALFGVILSGMLSVPQSLFGQDAAKKHPHKANRLVNESSPYLLQHAYNPVDWYPWGTEALDAARKQDKPIFLSIGYSSCFWCHVMERKVFENEEIAKFMNEHFICIKVDREERPDLDEIYMLSLQVYFQLSGSGQGGGWPLSIFLTPAGEPIAGGTYFPPEDLPGRPGFPSVLNQLNDAWNQQKPAVQRTATALSNEVKRLSQPPAFSEGGAVNLKDVQDSVESVLTHYDPVDGGFDFNPKVPDKPKFPVPSRLMLLQSQIARNTENSTELAQKLDKTLDEMSDGGIYDHLGGGFHRYSTDREWLIPHFEKMLYDNAQLAEVYAEAYQRTRKKRYREIAEGIMQFVLNEMTDKSGAFYSALDAETDGVEGQYYVWSKEEVQNVLNPNGYRYFAAVYGLDQESKFEQGYVLHLSRPVSETAQQLGLPAEELETRLSRMRAELLKKRLTRKPLRRDDKILTSWNGLMIRAFARTGKILQRQDYVEHANKAALYLLSTLRDREGRLLRTAMNDKASLPAYLDDYAFLVSGLLALHDATGEEKWLNTARLLTDNQINQFWDRDRGGFFFTSHDHESLIARTKSAYDSVIPSGNSVSIQNLTKLASLTGDSIYANHAQQTIDAFASQFRQSLASLPYFAMATQAFLISQGNQSVPNGAGNLFTGGVSAPMNSKPEAPKESPIIVSLTPAEPDSLKDAKASPRGFFGLNAVTAGGAVPVAIEITIAEGWHINANPAQPDFVIPTELKIAGDSKLKLSNIQYPKGHQFKLEGIDQALSVYEGKVLVKALLHIPEGSQGEIPVKIQLQSQACDSKSCLAPKRVILQGSIKVLPAGGDQPQPINQAIFRETTSK